MTQSIMSMTSLSNMTVLMVPLEVWSQLLAMMAKPIVWMPVPFDETGPSQGGGEGIIESEDSIHRNLGLNPIFVAPFLHIPPYSLYRNQVTSKNKPSTASAG
jgi:hypothetical protein